MIIHGLDFGDLGDDEAFIFAALGGFTISVCAPRSWSKEDVETAIRRDSRDDGWTAVDKSTLGLGAPTPNPCNHDDGRKHWFMMRTP